jgi:hypothetical protein
VITEFTKEELKDKSIEYIIVEVGLKGKKDDKSMRVKGLFLGFQPIVGTTTLLVGQHEKYIWLYRGSNIFMLNPIHYEIRTVEIKGPKSEMIYNAKGSESKQREYYERLSFLQEYFADKKAVLVSGLIDPEQYTVPDKLKQELEVGGNHNKISAPTPVGKSAACGYGIGSSRKGITTYGGNGYVAKKPSTTIIHRTTKYPIAPALKRMEDKIAEIKAGTYEKPKLPAIPADKEVEKPSQIDNDLDDGGYGYFQ